MKKTVPIIVLLLAGILASWLWLSDSIHVVKTTHSPKANRLVYEKSPYLLQHAYNPVDWYPWGNEAFEKAKKENKPIFLSIGYSTCHWCHVMEHESFENHDVAQYLNEHFVSIKLDREERPDLDQIYMAATQAMTGQGGWPMSVWLNHDLKPFYAGTYFPPDSRYGKPGFLDLLKQIDKVWLGERAKIEAQSNQLALALKEMLSKEGSNLPISTDVIPGAYQYFQRAFDPTWGGFGNAPKFPRAVQFPFLFRYYASTGDKHALDMALFTLQRMARGGMYDQIGGGFARYSVDEEWRVPHFEKMLYDNGQLLSIYVDAWLITHDDFYQQIARDIIRYIHRDMTSPENGFYSAEDADSEGHEGTFYVWTEKEIASILGDDHAKVVAAYYDFRPGGNFEHDKNVLHPSNSPEATAKKTGKKTEEVRKIIEDAKKKLFEVRSKRIRPHLDDKILTSWNGLMISGLAKAAKAFGDDDYLKMASKSAEFVLKQLREPKTNRLLHRYRDKEAKGNAFLDDYAFLTAALLDLFDTSHDPRWLDEALKLTNEQVQFLWDEKRGGFYFAGADDPNLLLRPKTDYEGAEPSGNSVAALNLLRLAQLTDKKEYFEKAEQTIKATAESLKQFPASMPLMLCAFANSLNKPRQIVIAGDPTKKDVQAMLREVNQHYLPNTLLLLADGGPNQKKLAEKLPFLSAMKPVDGKATVYICEDYACKAPVTDLVALKKILGGK